MNPATYLKAGVAAIAGSSILNSASAAPVNALAKRDCFSGVDVFESPKGYKYALAPSSNDLVDCNNMNNIMSRAVGQCNATTQGYDAAAPFWHPTRDYYGSVRLLVQRYGNNDTKFQHCLDSAATVAKKSSVIKYAVGGGVAGAVVLGVAIFVCYKCL